MRRILALLVLVIVVVFAVSAMPGELIPYGDGLYDDMDMLFVLNGQSIPSASRPWTKSEALNELSKIDASSLDSRLQDLYKSILDRLDEGPKHEISLTATVAPEVYAHTNSDFDLEQLWVVNYLKRNPFLTASLDAHSGGFGFHTELSVGVGRATQNDEIGTVSQYVEEVLGQMWEALDSFPVDVSGRPYVLSSKTYGSNFKFNLPQGGEGEVETPRTAWLVYAWENGSVGVYKAKKTWGKTYLGNYIYDDHISTYDYVSAKFYNGVFNFDFTILFPYSFLGGSSASYSVEYQRIFLSHRFSVQFSPKFNFTLSENVMYWPNGGFEMLFTNPALIYHNNIECNLFNALAHIELEYVPIKGLRLYTQLGVDQGSVPGFEDEATEDLAAGLTLGAQYYFFLAGGMADVYLEGAIVTPAMYRRWSQYPDFIINDMTIASSTGDYTMVPFYTYLGFPYGGDTVAIKAGADYKKGRLSSSAAATFLWKGETNLFTKKVSFTGLELVGNVSFDFIAEISAKYDLSIWRFPVSVYATLSGVFDHNRGFDAQFTVGASVSAKGALSI